MPLVIAGERSGVGKTTITLSLLATLRQQQSVVQSFKVGPDYIDPMFHHFVTGRACRNLDPVLTSETYVQHCFNGHVQDAEYAVVEGVMGLFDGASGSEDWASTAHVARLLNLPILLVLDCSRLSRSVAAIAHGYQTFDPRLKIAGWVLNRVGSDRHLELLKAALEPLGVPILGILRRQDDITIPDRHLGLVPTDELPALSSLMDRLAHLGQTCFDWEQLLPLLKTNDLGKNLQPAGQPNLAEHPNLASNSKRWPSQGEQRGAMGGGSFRLAIARDRAFSFYYADNLEILTQLGVELIEWSPLQDADLPDQVHGLYFGGGFPEVFAAELAANRAAQGAVRAAILAGMPTYAECGGLMYLSQAIIDFAEQSWSMVGVLPTIAQMRKRLTLGYRRAIALQDGPLLSAGTTVWGHEFHRSTLTVLPQQPLYQMRGFDSKSDTQMEGWRSHQVHASYLHLHWGAQPEIPARFVQCCAKFAQVQLST